MTIARTSLRIILLAATGVVAVATTTSQAAEGDGGGSPTALPPQLVARLEADRKDADAALAAARRSLAAAARTQRTAQAAVGSARARRDLAESVAALVSAKLPSGIDAQLDDADAKAADSLDASEAKLELVTEDASKAQAIALDADRRIRALQRASRTQEQRDTSIGSYRFGSGGAAVSAQSLDDYLASKGSPIAGSGEALLKAGIDFRIDPRLIVAIAGAESYFGVETCAPFNAWGWSCPNGPARFTSWEHGIRTVAQGLRENYLDSGLTTVGEIHLRYAPPNAANDPTNLNYAWADNVAQFLVEQGGDPQDIDGLVGSSR